MSSVSYRELLRRNVVFRRVWLSDIVSLLGDWFNTLALYAVVESLTGSPLALGAVFIAKMLPGAIASPIAGVLVDRLNRRWLMIGSDVLRALIVLAMVLVDRPEEVPLLFVLAAAQVVVGAVFQPARSASLPMITSQDELLTANTLMAASWSTMLALGAASGGIVTAWLGPQAVFLVDALTYLVSASFLWRTVIPQETDAARHDSVIREAYEGVREGWHHLWQHRSILRLGVAKATWSLGGGGLVYLLALVGAQIEPAAPALGMGWLLAARGVGTGVGPIAARNLFRDRRRWPAVIGASIVLTGIFYFLGSLWPWSYWFASLVFCAHLFGGIEWVLSAVLLQERTPDRFRGRVFATEWVLILTAESVSILVASLLLETGLLGLHQTVALFAGLCVALGLGWSFWVVPAERRARPSTT